jgi:hypothetical protein
LPHFYKRLKPKPLSSSIESPHAHLQQLFSIGRSLLPSQKAILKHSYGSYKAEVTSLQSKISNSSYIIRLFSALDLLDVDSSSISSFSSVCLNLKRASRLSFLSWQSINPAPSLRRFHSSFLFSSPDYYGFDTLQGARIRAALRFNRSRLKASQRLYHTRNPSFIDLCSFSNCLTQNISENTDHILVDCPRFNSARKTLVKSLSILALPALRPTITTHTLSSSLILDPTSPKFSHMFSQSSASKSKLIKATSRFIAHVHSLIPLVTTS